MTSESRTTWEEGTWPSLKKFFSKSLLRTLLDLLEQGDQ